MKGRGSDHNPPNRFEALWSERDPEWNSEEDPAPKTEFLRDVSRSIIATNQSPDVGFDASVNPYRGCEHGCAYCYARPTHEYAGFSAGLDFETKILVKAEAPALLRQALASPRWKPQVVALSGVTDCYQPVERRLKLTRRCLEALVEFRNPVSVITKNWLVTRDIDLLGDLARHQAACVMLSVTTLDAELARGLEPRTAQPAARLQAIQALATAGIPVGVNVAPVIPGLTDHEIPAILEAARKAGASFAGMSLVRLPGAVAGIFERWLSEHRPLAKEKILHRLREVHGGRLADSRFGLRMRGEGNYAENLRELFAVARRKAGYPAKGPELSIRAFRRSQGPQLELFGS